MATTLDIAPRGTHTASRLHFVTRETTTRQVGAIVLGLAAATFTVGTAWDIQWHTAVGRDRTFTPPHILMLGGIALLGLVSLALILLDTRRAKRGAGVDQSNSSRMFRVFQAPVGLAVTGFGAALAALAFPFDDYWHTIYGIDVVLLAPFHVMLGFGVIMAELGVLYLIAAEAGRIAVGRAKTAIQIGFLTQLGVTLSTIMIYLVQGTSDKGLMHFGSYSVVFYPLLLAAIVPIGLLTAVWVTRRPGAATVTALTVLAVREVMAQFVPWAMTNAVAAEGLTYRPTAPPFVVTANALPLGILAAALLIDALYAGLRRRTSGSVPLLAVAGALIAVGETVIDQPWAAVLPKYYYLDMNPSAMWLATLPLTIVAAMLGTGLALLISRGLAGARQ